MHISIADDTKKRFHAACAIRGLKMSQVITELIEQWLLANEAYSSGARSNRVAEDKIAR
ncbi:hypothetical protein SD80_032245 [Scytonema tolypothrichoides VB-61278]|nr:hypothetical protein SD80_032245 [Scytonema tolypothrichoides VB-61278]